MYKLQYFAIFTIPIMVTIIISYPNSSLAGLNPYSVLQHTSCCLHVFVSQLSSFQSSDQESSVYCVLSISGDDTPILFLTLLVPMLLCLFFNPISFFFQISSHSIQKAISSLHLKRSPLSTEKIPFNQRKLFFPFYQLNLYLVVVRSYSFALLSIQISVVYLSIIYLVSVLSTYLLEFYM